MSVLFKLDKQDNTPTKLCFGSMCKNEEHVIIDTLNSVYKHIDYWVICDTGSTDNTCKLIIDFFTEKNIPGELWLDEWCGFEVNKSLLFERCYNKSDFLLHLDADDWLMGDFNTDELYNTNADAYFFRLNRGVNTFKATILYNNRVQWKYIGVAHNIIVCLHKKNIQHSHHFIRDETWIDAEERGIRSMDPEKYIKDARALKEQFFQVLYDDPHGIINRTAFYCAQSYMDANHHKEAIQWYTLYTKLKDTWVEEVFESHMRIARCMIHLKYDDDGIIVQMNKAIAIFGDRAEPYCILGKYFNDKSNTVLGYKYLKLAQQQKLSVVNEKYTLFVNPSAYGKYLNDELSVSCYWTKQYDEGLSLINEIIDDDDFANSKARIEKNKQFMLEKKGNYKMLSIITNIPNINTYPLTHVFEKMELQHKPNTLWLEFGVFSGGTINYISKFTKDKVYGFDSFEGLPEKWRNGFEKGCFNKNGNLPDVNSNVELIKGWFSETLPDFIKKHNKKVSFIHMDADLYSSTKCIFDNLKDYIDDDCVIVFDELINYDGFDGETGELKAFYEFITEHNVNYEWIGKNNSPTVYPDSGEQVALIFH
mgnify:FL=1|jgi:hypothetical protein